MGALLALALLARSPGVRCRAALVTIRHPVITLYCTVLHCTVLYCTVLPLLPSVTPSQHCTVLCCTVLHCTVLLLPSVTHHNTASPCWALAPLQPCEASQDPGPRCGKQEQPPPGLKGFGHIHQLLHTVQSPSSGGMSILCIIAFFGFAALLLYSAVNQGREYVHIVQTHF